MPVRYQPGMEITATLVWDLVKAQAIRPKYFVQHVMVTAQALVVMIWSRKSAGLSGALLLIGYRQPPRPQLDILYSTI
jgi:hypothetical protein